MDEPCRACAITCLKLLKEAEISSAHVTGDQDSLLSLLRLL